MSLKLAVAVLLMLRVSDVLGSTDCDVDEMDLCDDDAMGGGGSVGLCDDDETDLCDDQSSGGGGSVCDADEMDLCDAGSGGSASGDEECRAAVGALIEVCPVFAEASTSNPDDAMIAQVCMAECVEKMDSASMTCKDAMSSDMKDFTEMLAGVSFTCSACGRTWMAIVQDCGMMNNDEMDMALVCAPGCQDGLSRLETEGCSDAKTPGDHRRLAILEPVKKLMKRVGSDTRRLEGHMSQDSQPQTLGAMATMLKEMCNPEGCVASMMAMGTSCVGDTADYCNEGPCKTALDAFMANCKDDPMGSDTVASMETSLPMMCGAVGGCIAAMADMAPKCGMEEDTELDTAKICGEECQAVLQSFTTDKCFEGLGDRRLSKMESAIAKRDLARIQKLGQERRLTSHAAEGDTDSNAAMMMMVMMKPVIEAYQAMCGNGEKTCMSSIMSLPTSCPAMNTEGEGGDEPSEEMVKQICDEGACKTNVNEAMIMCLADPDDTQSTEAIKGFASMNMMCSPCFKHMMNMPAACGLDTDQPDVTTMCGFACTAEVEAWDNNKCDVWVSEMAPMMSGDQRRLATKVAEVATKVMPKWGKNMALAPATHNRLRRLEGHDHEDEDGDDGIEGIKNAMAMIKGMCTPCGKMIGALSAKDIHCISGKGASDLEFPTEADLANSTCLPLFCGMKRACPEKPAEVPIPMMPLEEYNAVRDVITGITCAETAAPTPAPVAVMSVVFGGDFATVVGTKKDTFLAECTQSMSNGVACVDVRAGSLIVDVSGPEAAVEYVVNDIKTKGTLQLPSFEPVQYESSAPLVTTTMVVTTAAPVAQEQDADGATRVFGAVASTGLLVVTLMNLFM